MATLRSLLRREFPPGWWHSGRWWTAGMADMGLGLIASFVTVVLIPRVLAALRHRGDLRRLRTLDRTIEGYVTSLLLYGSGLIWLIVMLVHGSSELTEASLLAPMALWAAVNATVAAIASALVLRSRWVDWIDWSVMHFIEVHAPVYDRSPETIEEYEARRLNTPP